MLQCVVVCVAVCVVVCVAVCYSVMYIEVTASRCPPNTDVLQRVAVCCSVL